MKIQMSPLISEIRGRVGGTDGHITFQKNQWGELMVYSRPMFDAPQYHTPMWKFSQSAMTVLDTEWDTLSQSEMGAWTREARKRKKVNYSGMDYYRHINQRRLQAGYSVIHLPPDPNRSTYTWLDNKKKFPNAPDTKHEKVFVRGWTVPASPPRSFEAAPIGTGHRADYEVCPPPPYIPGTFECFVTGDAHCTTNPDGIIEVEKGKPLSATATPDDGYWVHKWTANNVVCDAEDDAILPSVTMPVVLRAHSAPLTYEYVPANLNDLPLDVYEYQEADLDDLPLDVYEYQEADLDDLPLDVYEYQEAALEDLPLNVYTYSHSNLK